MSEEKEIIIEAIVEIEKHGHVKYEWDDKQKRLVVDRILYGSDYYPQNYGFIPNTLDWDGDALDMMIFSYDPLLPGSMVKVRLLGQMNMIDSGETDTKLIGVIAVDPRFDHIKALADIPPHYLAEMQTFFETYKLLQHKVVKIEGFSDLTAAKDELATCYDLYDKYHDLSKTDFLKKMKKERPDKYR